MPEKAPRSRSESAPRSRTPKAPRLRTGDAEITTADLERHAKNWLLDGELRQLSKRTLEARRFLLDKLVWFLKDRDLPICGATEIRAFLAYVNNAHEQPEGRWGNPHMKREVRPRTTHTYWGNLRTFFRFLVSEGVMQQSPVEAIRPPVARPDQIQPFHQDQIKKLLDAARLSPHPARNEAILMFLLDTGARASEVCSLRVADLDLDGRRCRVLGKGNKHRNVFFGASTTKVLWRYLSEHPREPDAPLFAADSGRAAGEPLTRSGLLQLIHRLGEKAGLDTVRCSPHTFRHTFAVEFLRAGGNVFTLQQLLGHTSLTMTNRYVALAQADLEAQHRQFSPVERLKKASRAK